MPKVLDIKGEGRGGRGKKVFAAQGTKSLVLATKIRLATARLSILQRHVAKGGQTSRQPSLALASAAASAAATASSSRSSRAGKAAAAAAARRLEGPFIVRKGRYFFFPVSLSLSLSFPFPLPLSAERTYSGDYYSCGAIPPRHLNRSVAGYVAIRRA